MTLPAKLTKIINSKSGNSNYLAYNSYLFRDCTSLKYVDMSACTELTELPSAVFYGCTAIETLLLPPNLQTIHNGAFGSNDADGALKSLKEITIPASVTAIGGYAFANCTAMESVTFDAGSLITELGVLEKRSDYGGWGLCIFANTPALKKVTLPRNLTVIGNNCFENSGVAEIDLPATVTTIGDCAFRNCDNLKDAGLTASLVHLGDEAYYDCNSLEVADLAFGLEYLGSKAFALCNMLKKAYIPATVTSIAGNPFAGCSGVESFELDPDNAAFTIVDGVLYDKTMYTILYYPASLTAETFQFPETVHEIAEGAFAGSKLKVMVIPNQITAIPASAFQRSVLESITFHKGMTKIGDYAFEGCPNLNHVNVLNSITYLGNYAFANCTALSEFTFEDISKDGTPYTIGQHFFDGCTAITELILPNQLRLTDEEVDAIGDIYNASACIPSYMFANTNISRAIIPAFITDIFTSGVFYNCKQLEVAVFEAKKLDSYAPGEKYFYGCSKLKELTIPSGTDWPLGGHDSFAYCTSLEKLTIYCEYEIDAYSDLEGCTSLKELTFWRVEEYEEDDDGNVIGYADVWQDYIYYMNRYALKGTKLTYLYMGNEDYSYIGGLSFAGSAIETVVVTQAEGIYSGSYGGPFSGTTNLKNVWISSNGCLYIDEDAFVDLDTDINFYFYDMTYEELVEEIGDDAWFTNASSKAHFYFKDTMPTDVEIPEDVKNDMA